MLIKCCFAITVMVDTISSASSRSSLKFPPVIGTIHHVLLQHLDSYLDHAMLFPTQVQGGDTREFHLSLTYALYIYLCMHIFLVDQFIPLIGFNIFVQQNLLRIYILMTLYITTLHIMTAVMLIHGLIHDGQLRACPCALLGLMYGLRQLYTIKYLGFQFVGDGIKGPNLSFSFQFFQNSFVRSFSPNKLRFLDVHSNHCTATVYIHFISFFLCNSIIHENFISASLVHYIYMCACISFQLISLYL